MQNPCVSCGACCARFRVAFYWAEAGSSPGAVPEELTERLDPFRAVMSGTNSPEPRCTALAGAVGSATRCSIYESRPSVCREVQPAWAGGRPSPQCDRARSFHGLPPLVPGWDAELQ